MLKDPQVVNKVLANYLRRIGVREEVIATMMEKHYDEVITFTEEEVASSRDIEIISKYVEWKIIERDAPYIEDIRRYIEGTRRTVDIVKVKNLVEVKNWSEEYFSYLFKDTSSNYFRDVVDQIKWDRMAIKMWNKNKVYLVFFRHIKEELFKEGISELIGVLEAELGEDTS